MANVIKAIIYEGTAVVLMARVRSEDGETVTAADIDTVTARVFNRDTGEEVEDAPTLTAADCFEDELVTDDPRWTVDATGYNFAAVIPAASFPEGDVTYRVQIKVTPEDGDAYPLVYDLKTIDLLGE